MTVSRSTKAALLAATALISWSGVAAAQDATTLSGVTVTPSQAAVETTVSYRITRSTTATKTDTPLIDVPQSVSVVSLKQIADQAASSIGDAIRYVPGVFSAQGEGNRETLVFRGNSTTGDFFVDGVRDDVQTYRDLYNIERLEIFKGSNAMIFGRGGIGGVANRVTKVADWTPVQSFQFEVGSWASKRFQMDVGAAVNDWAAVRLTGVGMEANSYRDGVEFDRWGFNPTASFKLGPTTTATVGYEHFEDERIADRGVPSRFLPSTATPATAVRPLKTRRGQFFGDPAGSPTWTYTDAATMFVEHRFSDKVSIRNRTRYADYDKAYQNVFAGAVNAAETTVSLSAYNNATRRINLLNQTDLNAQFDTGAIQHTLLAGAEFGRQRTENHRLEGRFAGGAASLTVPIAASNQLIPTTWTAIASSSDNKGATNLAAGYIQDQIAFTQAIQLILGVRYEHFNTKVYDRRTVGFPVGQQRAFDVTDKLWSPRAGLVYKPAANASIYGSYSRTYQPRGGDQLTGLSITNQSLDPEKFDSYEIGAKWDVLPSLNLAAAVYQLDRSNVLALSDPNNAASLTIPIGRQRTKGVEFSAAGSLTDRLSLVGAYTYSDGSFLDTVSGTVKAGAILANMPKHSASLWTRFDPTAKIGAAVGLIYQGKRYAATDNLVYMPGYTRVDAGLYYKVTPRITAQLNVENLFDRRYFVFANSNNNITPGSPRAAKLTLRGAF